MKKPITSMPNALSAQISGIRVDQRAIGMHDGPRIDADVRGSSRMNGAANQESDHEHVHVERLTRERRNDQSTNRPAGI